MKNLNQYIKESILDDEEDIVNVDISDIKFISDYFKRGKFSDFETAYNMRENLKSYFDKNGKDVTKDSNFKPNKFYILFDERIDHYTISLIRTNIDQEFIEHWVIYKNGKAGNTIVGYTPMRRPSRFKGMNILKQLKMINKNLKAFEVSREEYDMMLKR